MIIRKEEMRGIMVLYSCGSGIGAVIEQFTETDGYHERMGYGVPG